MFHLSICLQTMSPAPPLRVTHYGPLADPEGVHGVRSNPFPVPVFKYAMNIKKNEKK